MDTVQLLRDSTAAVRVRFEWLGVRKTLSRHQIDQAASPFGAEGRMVSAAKRILDCNHPAVKKLARLRADIITTVRNSTLPYVEDGVRLLPREDLSWFDSFMQRKRNALQVAALDLETVYDDIQSRARSQLGNLFNANDYPADVANKFKVEWEYPPLDPPNYLAETNPALFEQEQEKLKTRFAEAAKLAEEAFITEFANLTAHLAERLQPQPDGAQKVFHASAIENLDTFFERFWKLNVTGNPKIEELIEEARNVIKGISPKAIRTTEGLRNHLKESMETLTVKLDGFMVDKPRRKITQLKKKEASDVRAAHLLSA